MKIVVIDGGGLVGFKLVTDLDERGHQAVAASADTGVDTLTGEGLANVLVGASVVVDVSDPASSGDATFEFFDTSTRNLLAAEAAAGVGHHVARCVVIAQEELIKASSIPYSIVRATRLSADVVRALARLAVGPPLNDVIEISPRSHP